MSLRVVALVALALSSAALRASPVCDTDGDESDDAPAFVDSRVILPCAIADTPNGCADAAIYVMTTGGVLLCEIDIPALVERSTLPEVEQIPGVPAAPSSAAASLIAMPPSSSTLPALIVRDLPVRAACVDGKARDGHTWRHIPPS